MSRTVPTAVWELLRRFPDTEEILSHGAPCFKVSGKTFAYWAQNHHGDARAALWLAASVDTQQALVSANADAYFVPPYLGVKGWVGVDLNQGLAWKEIVTRVTEAWGYIAANRLLEAGPGDVWSVPAPDTSMTPAEINPWLGEQGQAVLQELSSRCQQLPETRATDAKCDAQWSAGKKVFVRGHITAQRLKLLFWVGAEQQAFLTADPRYTIPVYYGANGWIELDVQEFANWQEIEGLLEGSYRHFALKRMLRAMDENSE